MVIEWINDLFVFIMFGVIGVMMFEFEIKWVGDLILEINLLDFVIEELENFVVVCLIEVV